MVSSITVHYALIEYNSTLIEIFKDKKEASIIVSHFNRFMLSGMLPGLSSFNNSGR